jgi:hypothetical protein
MFPDQVSAHRWAAQVECGDLIGRLAGNLAACAAGEIDRVSQSHAGW